jgi:guanylate kinase
LIAPAGTALVLAGPSGVGKGTVGKRLRDRVPDLVWSVSWTTRPPRPGEVDGVDYHFVTPEAFRAEAAERGFLESFEVYGDLKGTPAGPVLDALAAGRDVLVEIDVQGALAVRQRLPQALLVFVKAPSREVQRQRLLQRAGDDPVQLAEIEGRLAAAAAEEAQADRFDHVVVNDDVDRAAAEVAGILTARRASGPGAATGAPPST